MIEAIFLHSGVYVGLTSPAPKRKSAASAWPAWAKWRRLLGIRARGQQGFRDGFRF